MYEENISADEIFIKKYIRLSSIRSCTCVIANKAEKPKFKTIYIFFINYLRFVEERLNFLSHGADVKRNLETLL